MTDYRKTIKADRSGKYKADLPGGRATFRIVHENSSCPALLYNDPGLCTCEKVEIKQVLRKVEFITFKIDHSFD